MAANLDEASQRPSALESCSFGQSPAITGIVYEGVLLGCIIFLYVYMYICIFVCVYVYIHTWSLCIYAGI